MDPNLITEQIMTLVSQVLDFWILVSILATLSAVQLLKGALKHYIEAYFPYRGQRNFKGFIADPVTRKIMLLISACFIGYFISKQFLMSHNDDWESFAYAIALLNPLIYQLTLIFAQRRGWVRVVGLLKMRKVVADKETGKLKLEDTLISHTDDLGATKSGQKKE